MSALSLSILKLTSVSSIANLVKQHLDTPVNSVSPVNVTDWSYIGLVSLAYQIILVVTDYSSSGALIFNDGNGNSNSLSINSAGIYYISGFPQYSNMLTVTSLSASGTYIIRELNFVRACTSCSDAIVGLSIEDKLNEIREKKLQEEHKTEYKEITKVLNEEPSKTIEEPVSPTVDFVSISQSNSPEIKNVKPKKIIEDWISLKELEEAVGKK